MKLENEFTVPASIDDAWAVLLDIPRVAPCLPGATVEPGGDDGTFNGTMKVKIGPISASYKGTVKIEEADEASRRVAMRAQAKDARGQGTAAATITSTMEETSDGTKVHVETDMRITGAAAQFGRGVMQDVSAKMMKRFADCLAEEIGSGSAAQAAAEEPAAATPEPTSSNGDAAEVPSASSGVSSAEATPPPSASSGVSSATTTSPPPPRPTEDVLDIAEVSREAVLKRALPVVGAAVALLILLRLIRR
jgi:carbon monoxide dehydrogenase subunit G